VIFRDLRSDVFHLQQANALYADDPTTVKEALARMKLSEPELFWETCPSERSSGFPTAIAAIAHHKAEFADMLSQSKELVSAVQHFPDR
jgi:hypothetical protein